MITFKVFRLNTWDEYELIGTVKADSLEFARHLATKEFGFVDLLTA